MSKNFSLSLNLEQVKAGDRSNLLDVLRSFGERDHDFNGENEYYWEETIANGFDSNLEYLIDTVKNIADDEHCVSIFFDAWMSRDKNYYVESAVNLLKDSENRVTAISFAYMSEC